MPCVPLPVLAVHEVHLGEAAGELAREDREAAVDGEVRVVHAGALRRGDRILQLHGHGIAEVESLQRLGDDDRGLAVGGEIHVVGIGHVDRRPRLSGFRIDRREAPLGGALRVVGDPQGLHVPRGHHVLRIEAHLVPVHDLEGLRIDHVHVVRLHVRHVDELEMPGERGAQLVGADLAIEVLRIRHRWHARHGLDLGAGFAKGEAQGGANEGAAQSSSCHLRCCSGS